MGCGENAIAAMPVIVVELPVVHVPLAIVSVPVHIHGEARGSFVCTAICATTP